MPLRPRLRRNPGYNEIWPRAAVHKNKSNNTTTTTTTTTTIVWCTTRISIRKLKHADSSKEINPVISGNMKVQVARKSAGFDRAEHQRNSLFKTNNNTGHKLMHFTGNLRYLIQQESYYDPIINSNSILFRTTCRNSPTLHLQVYQYSETNVIQFYSVY
jgi:hypothetical protein